MKFVFFCFLAADILNITLTSAFIDLYKRTSTQWHNDYFKSETDK